MIVLVGFMGSGKTTVARLLAERLGLPFVDTDHSVERSGGRSVAAIFAEDGEARFRALESNAVEEALRGPEAIVALGGGALGDPATRAALEWHTVIALDVSYPEAMRRVGHDPGRPLLHISDPRALYEERRRVYEEAARHVVDTTGATPEEVAARIIEATGAARPAGPAVVRVELGARSYPVFIGAEIAGDVADRVDLTGVKQAFVVTHPHLAEHAKPLLDSFETSGVAASVLEVPDGEQAKKLTVAEELSERLARSRAHRSDVVVAFGGGVVCDLAGFVASIFHRGMRLLQVPTSLLAQVDAAVGGKTAVNLALGKNLVGTFHQPDAVICDVGLLRSLPPEELRSGMAEVVKYGLISDPSLLDFVRSGAQRILATEADVLTTLVRRSVAIKAAVVAADETETGAREILNYGHTFGHAIEHTTGTRHGEAVALGMMAAAHLSVDLGMLDSDGIDIHRTVLASVGLPITITLDVPAALGALGQDKKHRDGMRFVVLERIGSVRRGIQASEEQVTAALRSVSA